jgi:hypothetical protein
MIGDRRPRHTSVSAPIPPGGARVPRTPPPGLRFQPDGSCALVVGELDKVPEAAGGLALRIVVTGARVTALPGT